MVRMNLFSLSAIVLMGVYQPALADCGCAEPSCAADACCESVGCGSTCCDNGCGNLYLKGFGGLNWLTDLTSTGAVRVDESFNTGFIAGLAAGYDTGNGSRVEFEFAYRSNDTESLLLNGAPQNQFGNVEARTYMVNYLREFDTDTRLRPYVGVGVGVADITQDVAYGAVVIDDSDATFGYQFMAGANYCVSHKAEAFVEYRYLGTADHDIIRTPPAGAQVLDSEYDSHGLIFGLTVKR